MANCGSSATATWATTSSSSGCSARSSRSRRRRSSSSLRRPENKLTNCSIRTNIYPCSSHTTPTQLAVTPNSFSSAQSLLAPRTTPSRQVEALIERRQAHPPNLRLHNLLAISGPKGKDWRQIQPSTLSPDRFSGSGIKVRFGGNGMLFTHPCGSSAWP